jgi:hypothetical protein
LNSYSILIQNDFIVDILKSMKNQNQELIDCDENGSGNEDDIDTHILSQTFEKIP